MTIIPLELNENIATKIEQSADILGLTPEGLLKFIIGWAMQNAFFLPTLPPSPSLLSPILGSVINQATFSPSPRLPLPSPPETRLMIKILMLAQAVKCPNCTAKLTLKDIEEGKCSKCEGSL